MVHNEWKSPIKEACKMNGNHIKSGWGGGGFRRQKDPFAAKRLVGPLRGEVFSAPPRRPARTKKPKGP
uniref:Uncharacterized protein n=1 Tax=Cucumis melo TaxID=3656 RepID=A0A9I9E5Y7_CUCME